MARRTINGMSAATYEARRCEACTKCGAKAPSTGNEPQRDGQILCSPCITEINRQIDADRTAANAAADRCEGCRTRRGTKYMLCSDGRVLVCGSCQTKANRHFRTPQLFAAPKPTTADLISIIVR